MHSEVFRGKGAQYLQHSLNISFKKCVWVTGVMLYRWQSGGGLRGGGGMREKMTKQIWQHVNNWKIWVKGIRSSCAILSTFL